MKAPFLNLMRRPHATTLPSIVKEGQRCQLRVLTGDDATTADELYFGRSNAGTMEWYKVTGQPGTYVNPLTTQDDIIVAGVSGVQTRFAKGTDGQVLTVDPSTHHLLWSTPAAAGMTNPMTTIDDIIVAGASGTPGRLAKGSDGQVLTVDPTTHHLIWATPTGSYTDPLTTKGDTVARTASTTVRKAVGANGTVLSANSAETDGTKWVTLSSLMPGVIFGGWISQNNYALYQMVAGAGVSATGNALTANSMVACLFAVPVTTTFDQITAQIITGVAATTLRLGVYAVGTDGLPGALIADWGTVSSATSSTSPTLSISWTPAAGWYYLVMVSSGAPTVPRFSSGMGVAPFGNAAGSIAIGGITDWIKASVGSSSALPDPFGASPTATGTHRPLWLRAA